MYCIPPIEITPTNGKLESTSVAEPDATQGEIAWVSGTNYAKDDIRILVSTHRKYKAIVPITGSTTAPNLDPDKWQDIGATNKYAMIELDRNNATVSSSSLTFVINPGERIDSFFLGGLAGTHVLVEVLDSSNAVVTEYEYSLTMRNTISWKTYFFGKFKTQQSLIRFDLPLIYQGKLRVTITNTGSGGTAISSVIVGTAEYIGEVQWEPESDAQNFSKIERSFDGTLKGGVTLIRRRSVPTLSLNIWSPKNMTTRLFELRDELNAIPVVWSGLDQNVNDPYYNILLILGIYRNFKINLKYPDYVLVQLSLEEM